MPVRLRLGLGWVGFWGDGLAVEVLAEVGHVGCIYVVVFIEVGGGALGLDVGLFVRVEAWEDSGVGIDPVELSGRAG